MKANETRVKGCYKVYNSHLRAGPEEKINSFQNCCQGRAISRS